MNSFSHQDACAQLRTHVQCTAEPSLMLAQAAKRAREPSKQQTNKPNALDQTICPENNYNEHIYLVYIYSYVVSITLRKIRYCILLFLRHAILRKIQYFSLTDSITFSLKISNYFQLLSIQTWLLCFSFNTCSYFLYIITKYNGSSTVSILQPERVAKVRAKSALQKASQKNEEDSFSSHSDLTQKISGKKGFTTIYFTCTHYLHVTCYFTHTSTYVCYLLSEIRLHTHK